MVDPKKVSAVIPTRGDQDLMAVLNNLPFDDVIVWDNSKRDDLSCYGRFAAVAEAKHDLIYTQDDDILVPVAEMVRRYNPKQPGVFANKPVAEEWRFLGVGAFFHRDSVDCFDRYWELYEFDDGFCRVADVVYAYQHPYEHDWFGYAELQWSRTPNSMYVQPGHMAVRDVARTRTLALPDRV